MPTESPPRLNRSVGDAIVCVMGAVMTNALFTKIYAFVAMHAHNTTYVVLLISVLSGVEMPQPGA